MTVQVIVAHTLVCNTQDAPLRNHAVVFENDKIIAIETAQQARQRQNATITELPHHLVMPGLVNAHTHLSMNLLRGIANDLPLMTWLQEHIWPAENAWLGEAFVADGMRLAFAESIRAGVTQFNDMYLFPEVGFEVATEVGVRASLGLFMIDFPTAYGAGPKEYFSKADALLERFADQPLLTATWGPHAPYSVSEEHLIRLREYQQKHGMKIHMHVHETADETSQYQAKHGMRPLEHLHQLGLLGDGLIAVHMTQLDDKEIKLVADSGTHIGHCPESNLKLASGFCPTHKLLEAGVNIAIGTDGVASNNDLCMLSEMRIASFLAKANSNNAAAFNAAQTVACGTINGAKALGTDAISGSLSVGKQADMIALNINNVETAPMYHAIDHIAYSADRQQVDYSWVAGKLLLDNRRLTTIDMTQTLERAQYWREKILPTTD